jgi:hypothetical protein
LRRRRRSGVFNRGARAGSQVPLNRDHQEKEHNHQEGPKNLQGEQEIRADLSARRFAAVPGCLSFRPDLFSLL